MRFLDVAFDVDLINMLMYYETLSCFTPNSNHLAVLSVRRKMRGNVFGSNRIWLEIRENLSGEDPDQILIHATFLTSRIWMVANCALVENPDDLTPNWSGCSFISIPRTESGSSLQLPPPAARKPGHVGLRLFLSIVGIVGLPHQYIEINTFGVGTACACPPNKRHHILNSDLRTCPDGRGRRFDFGAFRRAPHST